MTSPAPESRRPLTTRSAGWEPDGTVRTLDAGGRPLREMRLSGSLEFQLK